jgi:endonuclease/exonuclease/phosphatase family metal-dependent hydrolase
MERPGYAPALVCTLLLIVPILLYITWKRPAPIQPDPSNRSLRVMTYNLHDGVNTDGRLDIESQARIIEESGADVIALQEVSRGWLIWGGLDMLAWLTQRLELPYISGPTADAQWGNAILSRYPVVESHLILLPPDDLVLQRGYIRAEIDIGGGRISMLATHFHHAPGDDEIRELQASVILAGIPAGEPSLLLGDLNARPDSEAMRILAEAGLINVAAAIGDPPTYTYYAASPDHQIDYIWITPDLSASDFSIPRTTASDHLPMVTTVHLK